MDAEKMMMQRRIDNLIERLEMVKQQRDAALWDMQLLTITNEFCRICKHFDPDEDVCSHVTSWDDKCFEWRGLVKENGGVEDA